MPVTTDPHDIAAFLRRRSGPRVVFSTYQSSPQIAAAFALGRVPAFDLVIADEAHRVAGLESSDFATVLDATAIKARRRLFMTATPRYFTGRVLKAAQDADLEVASMDDASKFGTVFHRLTFGEAIKRDLLTDYQVAVVGVDNDTYREWAEKGTLVTRDGKKITDARTLAGQIGLAKAMRKYDLHRTISFHSRVARAREFAAEMPEVIAWMPARQRPKGVLWSSYASGEMTAGERHVRLQHLSRLDDGRAGSAGQRPLPGRGRGRARPSTAWRSSTPAAPRWTSSRRSGGRSASRTTRPSAPSSSRCSSTPTPTPKLPWTIRRSSRCGT